MAGKRDKRIAYISGVREFKKYEEAEKFLESFDFEVYSPMQFEDDNPQMPRELAMEYNLAALRGCNVIFMLTGWQNSRTATEELKAAFFYNNRYKAGIAVVHQEYTSLGEEE